MSPNARKGYEYTKPRVPIGAMFSNPGPIYGAPPLIGEKNHDRRSTHPKAPAYSFGLKTESQNTNDGPGPAHYGPKTKLTNRGPDHVPRYSIGQLLKYKHDEVTPGPSDYNTSKATNALWPKAPQFALGQYLKEHETSDSPAPNAYKLPRPDRTSDKPSAPAHSLGKILHNDKTSEGPGPSDYRVGKVDAYLPSSPKYTMATGAQLPDSRILTPSPAHYQHDLVSKHKQNGPAFTFGILHSPYKGKDFKEPPIED